jgi:hypothetical protein
MSTEGTVIEPQGHPGSNSEHDYLVYITVGGLQEDPVSRDEKHRTVRAVSLDDAVAKWADAVQLQRDDTYNLTRHPDGSWMYWGWRITVRKLA